MKLEKFEKIKKMSLRILKLIEDIDKGKHEVFDVDTECGNSVYKNNAVWSTDHNKKAILNCLFEGNWYIDEEDEIHLIDIEEE